MFFSQCALQCPVHALLQLYDSSASYSSVSATQELLLIGTTKKHKRVFITFLLMHNLGNINIK